MANEIKDSFGGSTALTISLGGLADGAGRQSSLVDNSASRDQDVLVYVRLRTDTAAAADADAVCEVYLLRGDADDTTEHVTDGAGASDAAFSVKNAPLIGVITTGATPAAGDVLYGEFLIHRPGPSWGVAVVNRTGLALSSTAGDHWVRFVGLNPEVQ